MTDRTSQQIAVNRGRLCGLVLGLAVGLALLLAPSALASSLSVSGIVNAVAPDGSGGYYAGGSFTVPSSTIVNAVHINSDGTLDTSWSPNPTATVDALAVSGGKVYLGGNFSITSGVVTLSNLARVDATSGALDLAWNPAPTGTIDAIAVSGSNVYFGGNFSITVGISTVNNVARADTTFGVLDTNWHPNPIGTVNALAVDSANVYLGGNFTIGFGSTPQQYLARVTTTSGSLDTNWVPAPNGVVDAVQVADSTAYIGGAFTQLNPTKVITSSPDNSSADNSSADNSSPPARFHAAAISTGTGAVTNWNPSPNGVVNALAVSSPTVYLGGSFSSVVGAGGVGSAARNNTAAVDSTNGYDTGWNPDVDGPVNAVASAGAVVYLGGTFTHVGGASQSGTDEITPQYTLSVAFPGNGDGNVASSPAGINCAPGPCSQPFDNGTTVTLTASPAVGSTFTGWSGACSGVSTCVVTMNADTAVSANFALQHTLTVTPAGLGSGTVNSLDGGINCGTSCSHVYTDGTVVDLTAAPDPGSRFVNWSGACSGSGACSVTIGGDTAVTANFNPAHTLTVTPAGSGAGTVTSNPSGIDCGATCSQGFDVGASVTLTATPAAGSRFGGWSGACSGMGTCTVAMDADVSVTPTYVALRTLSVVAAGSGTVRSDIGGIDCGTSCSQIYDNGTTVSLTASPAAGSTFAGWSGGGCAGTGPCTVTLSGNIGVTAGFTAQRALTVSMSGSGAGSVSSNPSGISCSPTCSQHYADGTNVTLTASPAAGSTFAGWSGGGCSGTGQCTVTMYGDNNVSASFAPKTTKRLAPSAPKCTMRAQSSRILLAAPRRGKPKVGPGKLPVNVRCDTSAGVALSGVITELVGKKPRHGKQRTKTFRLGPARSSVVPNRSKTLTLTLPRAALTDLRHRARMSLVLTLTATGGAHRVTAKLGRLTGH